MLEVIISHVDINDIFCFFHNLLSWNSFDWKVPHHPKVLSHFSDSLSVISCQSLTNWFMFHRDSGQRHWNFIIRPQTMPSSDFLPPLWQPLNRAAESLCDTPKKSKYIANLLIPKSAGQRSADLLSYQCESNLRLSGPQGSRYLPPGHCAVVRYYDPHCVPTAPLLTGCGWMAALKVNSGSCRWMWAQYRSRKHWGDIGMKRSGEKSKPAHKKPLNAVCWLSGELQRPWSCQWKIILNISECRCVDAKTVACFAYFYFWSLGDNAVVVHWPSSQEDNPSAWNGCHIHLHPRTFFFEWLFCKYVTKNWHMSLFVATIRK